jgi:adenylyltransferase/sulfurtransferase
METCDIIGVHPSIIKIISGFEVYLAIKYLLGEKLPENKIYYFDLSKFEFKEFEYEKRENCPVCSKKEFPFLKGKEGFNAYALCGGGTFQIKFQKGLDIEKIEKNLKNLGECVLKPYFLRFKKNTFEIMFFKDGKIFIKGKDITKEKAKLILKKYLGI